MLIGPSWILARFVLLVRNILVLELERVTYRCRLSARTSGQTPPGARITFRKFEHSSVVIFSFTVILVLTTPFGEVIMNRLAEEHW